MDIVVEQEQLKRDLDQLRQLIVLDDELSQQGFHLSATTTVEEDIFVPLPDESSSSVSIPLTVCRSSDVFSTSASSATLAASKKRNLRRCLDLNIEYQAILQNYLNIVRQTKLKIQQEIFEKEQALQEERKRRSNHDNRRPTPIIHRAGPVTLACFRRPYFKSVFYLQPSSNEDVITKTYFGELLPSDEQYNSGWKWYNASLKDRLFKEVRRECLSRLLEPHVLRRGELSSLAGEIEGPSLQLIYRDIAEEEKTMKQIVRETDSAQLYRDQQLMKRVDWMRVAKRVSSSATHSTCKLVWNNYHSPLINKRPFKKKEDEELLRLVQTHGKRNWVEIAKILNTGRCAFQCLQRYRSRLYLVNKSGNTSNQEDGGDSESWRAEDEQRLMMVVDSLDLQSRDSLKYIDWVFVAQNVGQFSRNECCEKFIQLSSKLSYGPWSQAENDKLEEAVATFGSANWIPVSTFVETRSPKQCHHHWEKIVKKKNSQKLLGNSLPPEWTAEEDAVLWFNRHSSSNFLRNYTSIVRLLPGRLKQELADRFKLLKSWQKQAEWLLKNDGTLLSLIMKSDSELTMVEVQRLREELARLRLKRPFRSVLLPEDAEKLCTITLSEQSELERLANAMILEASLSRDLVNEKMKLIGDIVEGKAVPVPLLRNIPDHPLNDCYLKNRAEAFRKIKELLIKVIAERRSRKIKKAPIDPDEPSTSVVTAEKPPNFCHILSKIRNASKNPATTDRARELFLHLDSVTGGTQVKKLIKLSRHLDALASGSEKTPTPLNKPPSATQWVEYRCLISSLYWEKALNRSSCFYENLSLGMVPKRYKGRPVETFNQVARLLVSSLGTNMERVTCDARRQSEINLAVDRDQSSEIAANLNLHLPSLESSSSARIRRFHAKCALQAMTACVDDADTGRSNFTSIRDEFDSSFHVNAEDFAENDSAPVFPPNAVTARTFRLLSVSRRKLQQIFHRNLTEDNREVFMRRIRQLKDRPTEGYALLRRRFEALFTWPALLNEVVPQIDEDWSIPDPKIGSPQTPADVVSTTTLPLLPNLYVEPRPPGTFPRFAKKFDSKYLRKIRNTPFQASLPRKRACKRQPKDKAEHTNMKTVISRSDLFKKTVKVQKTNSVAMELAERALLRHQLTNLGVSVIFPPKQIGPSVIVPPLAEISATTESLPRNETNSPNIDEKPLFLPESPLSVEESSIQSHKTEHLPLSPQAEENFVDQTIGEPTTSNILSTETDILHVAVEPSLEIIPHMEATAVKKYVIKKRKNPLAPSQPQELTAPPIPVDSNDEPLPKQLPEVPQKKKRETRNTKKKFDPPAEKTFNLRSRPVEAKRAVRCSRSSTSKVLRNGKKLLPKK